MADMSGVGVRGPLGPFVAAHSSILASRQTSTVDQCDCLWAPSTCATSSDTVHPCPRGHNRRVPMIARADRPVVGVTPRAPHLPCRRRERL